MLAVIPLDLIENGQRLRELSEATVVSLVNSIGDVGLLNPVTVYRRKLFRGGNQVDGYGLVAGLHRKTACERLGLVEIEANILELSDLECQIAECDENLCAPQLSPSDRARFTKRRKEAYEALHPETRHGGDRKSDQVADIATRSFAEDQAEKTGAAERTVRLDAERGAKITDAALAKVKGTDLDTGTYLDKLKKLPPNDQVKAATRDLAFANQRHRQEERARAETAKRNKLQGDIKLRAAAAIGEWIAEHVGDDLEFVLANLHAAGASNIAHVVSGLSKDDDRSAA